MVKHMSNKPIVTKEDWLHTTDQGIIDHVYEMFVVKMAPRSTDGTRCSYLGPDQGCAVGCLWPLDKRQEVDQADMRGCGNEKISAIDELVQMGYVELPDNVDLHTPEQLQWWHDVNMSPVQSERHQFFPFLDRVTNPITVPA